MLNVENSTVKDSGGAARNSWAGRTCDTCRSAASAVYCRADLAYLCTSCDARIHAANQVASRHERVSVCEACERAPADFLCKADSASLCAACDSDIHSANPLARRHHRIPIQPIPGTLYGPSAADPRGLLMGLTRDAEDHDILTDGQAVDEEDDDDQASSWLLLNPIKNVYHDNQSNDNDNGPLFGGEVDEYLDLDDYNSCQNNQFNDGYNNQQQQRYNVPQRSYGSDSVVPIQYHKAKDEVQHHCFQLGLEYETSNAGYNYPASISQSVSLSPMDVGVVPESTRSEVSNVSHSTRPSKGTIDLFSSPPTIQEIPTQLSPVDREARMLRYREKKKSRKFEKTIRYASRKAYAETRPRIKGRFAKRTTDVEIEVDQMFSTSVMAESAYGVVTSF